MGAVRSWGWCWRHSSPGYGVGTQAGGTRASLSSLLSRSGGGELVPRCACSGAADDMGSGTGRAGDWLRGDTSDDSSAQPLLS